MSFGIELAKYVLDFGRMVCPEPRAFEVGGQCEVETITIDGLLAGGRLRLHPPPGRPGDEAVADEIFHGTLRFGIGIGRVQAQKIRRTHAKLFLRRSLHGVHRGLFRRSRHGEAALVVVPSGQQRNVVLQAGSEDCGERFAQKISIDVRNKIDDAAGLKKSVEQFLRRHGAELRQSLLTESSADQFRIPLFADRHGIERDSAAEKSRATLPDRLLEQAVGGRGGHQGADRKRSGALAEDGHVAGIAAECGDVVMDPVESDQLIEQAVVAG